MYDETASSSHNILNLFFLIAAGTFVLWFVSSHSTEFVALFMRADPFRLTLSMALLCLFVLLQGILGAAVLRQTGVTSPLHVTLPAILLSLLGKYIPGKIWVLTLRFTSLSRHSIELASIVAGSMVEHIFVIATGFVIFLLSASSGKNLVGPLLIVLSLSLFLIFLLFPEIILSLANALLGLAKKPKLKSWFNRAQNIRYAFYYTGTWLILGGSIFCLTTGLAPSVPPSSYLPITGYYALSVIAGFIAVFSPGGLGVREGIFVIGLRTYMPTVQAVFISIAARIIFSVAEIITISLVIVMATWIRKNRDMEKEALQE